MGNFSKPRKCRYCDNMTPLNPVTGRYGVLCGAKKCSDMAREQYKKNMMKAFGTHNLMNIPEYQVKMAKGRAKQYIWSGTKDIKYCLSNNEIEVCKWLDEKGFSSSEVLVGEKTLTYKYNGVNKTHIIDIFIPDINLIISVKDSLDNPNTRPSVIEDRKKNIAQYNFIVKKTNYNFIQVEGLKEDQFKKLDDMLFKISQSENKRFTYKPMVDYINESAVLVELNHFDKYILEENKLFFYEDGFRIYLEHVDDVLYQSNINILALDEIQVITENRENTDILEEIRVLSNTEYKGNQYLEEETKEDRFRIEYLLEWGESNCK